MKTHANNPPTQLSPDDMFAMRTVAISLTVAAVVTWLLPKLLLASLLAPFGVKGFPWWVYVILFVIAFMATGSIFVGARDKKKAKRQYQNALQDLKRDPNNPDLREKTLKLGRD